MGTQGQALPPDWANNVLKFSKRTNEVEEEKFVDLVEVAQGHCDLQVAKTLMKTFSDEPDYGTQEVVCSVLSTAPEEVQARAILEELPRLIREAPEWAETLIHTELVHRSKTLRTVAFQVPEGARRALEKVLESLESDPDLPGAIELRNELRTRLT